MKNNHLSKFKLLIPSLQALANVSRVGRCLLILGLVQGCGSDVKDWNLPLLYKIDIQQGNVVDQEMVNKLKIGMDKDKVMFIMGTPIIIDPFHSQRWDYIFLYRKGGDSDWSRRRITLHFEDEKLSYITGDVTARQKTSQVSSTSDQSSITDLE